MDDEYRLLDTSKIITPAYVVFRDVMERNLTEMLRIAGGPSRLRPHCKTHKMSAVARREIELGITKHKAATFAEAEMLAAAGAPDIFLAYNLVGPNIPRAVQFVSRFPDVRFSVTADDEDAAKALGRTMADVGRSVGVFLDLDTGQHRTGVEVGPKARTLYASITATPGLSPFGLHLYDGQNHQTEVAERRAAVMQCWEQACSLRDDLVRDGWPVPKIVCGGTGSFPIFATLEDPAIELSPGTCVFHDCGYGRMFPDLNFKPAALLLTRVISRPTANRITLDLGYKAVASDPPAGNRVLFPDLPDAQAVLQNEEHLVLETELANEFRPGDELFGIPKHVCPTSALHKQAYVVSQGRVVDHWTVDARDRWLSI